MVVRFNFATAGSPIPAGYILDFGEAYTSERGYGWVQQADFSLPLDVTPNTRDRNGLSDRLLDSLIHMQYPNSIGDPTAVRTPAAWQHDIENGEYRVTVSVGDIDFFDSQHSINIEGVPAITDFVPDSTNPFATATEIVTVEDGTLNINAIGGENTKLNFVDIIPAREININFGAVNSPFPEDYIRDFGEAYSEGRGYGWVTEASAGTDSIEPLDITTNGRQRNLIDDGLQDSLIHMQYPESFGFPDAVRTAGAWEYELPNGEYVVTASVGDPAFADSIHTINAEGISVIDGFASTEENLFTVASEVITVDDGRLTIDAIGGENTKLNYLNISSAIDVRVNFAPEDFERTPAGFINDFGEAYSEDRGYGWITQGTIDSFEPIPIDITGNARERGLVGDPITDSLIHMQYPESIGDPDAIRTPAAWEYDLPNGTYNVRIGVGDPSFTDSVHQINVEDIPFIRDFVPTSDNLFSFANRIVEVDDGTLTIDAIGGENTKLNSVQITSVGSLGD